MLHNLLSSQHTLLRNAHERPVLGDDSDASSVTDSIRNSLLELRECAADLTAEEGDSYAVFARVAGAVLKLLPTTAAEG